MYVLFFGTDLKLIETIIQKGPVHAFPLMKDDGSGQKDRRS